MGSEITPSKQVSDVVAATVNVHQLTLHQQAASAIDNFKMESPVKKLDFNGADKENNPVDADTLANLAEQTDNQKPEVEENLAEKTTVDVKPAPRASVASTIKAQEAEEPLLQENPNRFVLFPIKYHEVCRGPDAS